MAAGMCRKLSAWAVLFLVCGLLVPIQIQAQEKNVQTVDKAWLQGRITDASGTGIPVVAVGIINLERPIGTVTDEKGLYRLQVPAGSVLELSFSHTSNPKRNQTIAGGKPDIGCKNARSGHRNG